LIIFNKILQLNKQKKKIEAQKIMQSVQNQKKGEEQQSAQLAVQKIRATQQEFELLRFAFSGARIFFSNK